MAAHDLPSQNNLEKASSIMLGAFSIPEHKEVSRWRKASTLTGLCRKAC